MNVRRSSVGCVVLLCCALLGETVASAQAQPSAAEVPAPPPPPAAAPVPAPAPPPPQYAAPPGYAHRLQRQHERRRPRRSRGMMIGGIVLFGVSYLVPAAIGGAVGSLDRGSCDCHDAYRMFIPVAGPLTLLHNERKYNPLNALLITSTVLQSAGILLTFFGILRYAASGQDEDEEYGRLTPNLSWMATPLPGGGYAALNLRLN